jgi:unsaturated rhamnogalacturonyl hydrolase
MPDADAALEKLEELANRVLDSGEVTGGISPHGVDSVVFVDALYGYPSSIVRLGLMTGSDRTVDRICALTARHCELVQSRASGLFSHFSPVRPDAQPLTTAWGRGNGWALLGLSDLLAVLPSSHDRYAELAERLRAGVEGARLHQCPDGSFRNIVDQAASYPESSATAMIEAAVSQGVALGFLDTKLSSMADRAWAAIEHRIDTNGHLVGVSYRPGVNEDLRRYEHTPAIGSYPWGQGAYLRAACARYVRSLNNQETSSTEGAR